jgi:hypothetical protein
MLRSLMIDPLLIIALSAALVSLYVKISKSLYKFICNSCKVDQALEAFYNKINEFLGFLALIESSFRDSRTAILTLYKTIGHK